MWWITYVSLGFQLVSILLAYCILIELKISNCKEPSRNNDRYLKQLIDKIDKVIVSDKINKE